MIAAKVMRACWGICILLMLIALAWMGFRKFGKHQPFSPPMEPRAWANAEFNALIHAVPSTDDPLGADYESKMVMTPLAGRVTGTPVHSLKMHVWELPPARIHVPQLKTLEVQAQDAMPFQSLECSELTRSSFQMTVPLNGYQNVNTVVRGCYDANTHVKVSLFNTSKLTASDLQVSHFLSTVHSMPTVSVVDVFHGSEEIMNTPLKAGETTGNNRFRLSVLKVMDGKIFGHDGEAGRLDRARDYDLTLRTDASNAECAMLYTLQPASLIPALTIEAIDHDGKVWPNRSNVSERAKKVAVFSTSSDRIASLRVKFRPHMTRLLVRQQGVTSNHPENRSPSNLFDVVIPEFTFSGHHELRDFICATTEMRDASGKVHDITKSGYPLTLQNFTPRQALELYRSKGPECVARINEKDHSIDFSNRHPCDRWHIKAWAWIKARCP